MTQDTNPYRPPASPVGNIEPAAPAALEPAHRGRRFGTFVVDYLGVSVFGMVFGGVIGLTMGEAGVRFMQSMPRFLLGVSIFFVYYAFFESIWFRTPGKWIFGTVVVDRDGRRPTLGQILGRTACRLIPFEAFSFFGEKGWHDSIPKTMVVRHVRGG